MISDNVNYTYIVAGDGMAQLMREKHPERRLLPFREDLSKGAYKGFSIDSDFVRERALFWGISEAEYAEKLSPIINIDLKEHLVLCFGEDECCRANLRFMLDYLKSRGYKELLRVQIVDEYSLKILEEYSVQY